MGTDVSLINQLSTSHLTISSEDQVGNTDSAMKKETDRLKSYKNWPCKFMEPSSLAKAGFYYVNEADVVRCAFCKIEIGQWREGDSAMQDHVKWSGGCPLVLGINCGNVPMSNNRQDAFGKHSIEIRPYSYPEQEHVHSITINLSPSRLKLQPLYSQYATLENRLKSFLDWCWTFKPKPENLAAAGFFYTGKDDKTICFHCGGGLKDWEVDDNPWEQHTRWFSKCYFVQIEKGQEYVSEICNKNPGILSSAEAAAIELPAMNNLNITSGKKNFVW